MLGGFIIPSIANENFHYHHKLIKFHYYIEQCLELNRISNANTSLEIAKIYPSILSMSVLDMQSNIFKINTKSNVAPIMEVLFHVNPLTWL
jgi:hypothetical protein